MVAKARNALAEENIAPVHRYLSRAQALAGPSQKSGLKPLFDQLDRLAEKKLAEADAQYEAARYLEALETYELIAEALGPMPAGETARARLAEAEKDPSVQAAFKEVRAATLLNSARGVIRGHAGAPATDDEDNDEAGACEEDDFAEDDESADTVHLGAMIEPMTLDETVEVVAGMPPEKQAFVLSRLQIVRERYAESPSGEESLMILSALEADEEIQHSIQGWARDQEVLEIYKMASMYHASHHVNKAVELYQQIVRDYPEHGCADQARQRLLDLGVRVEQE